jgi:hypothetical protein
MRNATREQFAGGRVKTKAIREAVCSADNTTMTLTDFWCASLPRCAGEARAELPSLTPRTRTPTTDPCLLGALLSSKLSFAALSASQEHFLYSVRQLCSTTIA